MSLEESTMSRLKDAMKAKDKGALRALRAIKAEILLFNTSGSGKTMDSTEETKLLQKMIKQRKDSLDIFTKEGRDDLAIIEQEEIAVISKFLPEQMPEAELRVFLQGLISELNVMGMQNMGRVMGEASKRLAGRAEGKMIAEVVKELLAG